MILDQFLQYIVWIGYAAENERFECSEFRMLSDPHNGVQIFLVVFLPVLADQLVPLLENTHKISKLFIFGPSADDLDGVERLCEKLGKTIDDLFSAGLQLNELCTGWWRISIPDWRLLFV